MKKGRQGTLEFLLINHPLDCPICDKGGECDLQDFTLRHGPGASRFDVKKRHFAKPIPVSENILLDRERCIACQRCVRFCQDVAMENGLVMQERGFKTEVGVEPDAPFDSIFSGNVVEMCPVGALTAEELSLHLASLGAEAHGERLRQLLGRLQCARGRACGQGAAPVWSHERQH